MNSSLDLDTDYGVPRSPKRVDDWEEDQVPMSRCVFGDEVAEALRDLERAVQGELLKPAAQSKNFIWAMNGNGDVVIAVEEIAPTAYDGRSVPRGYPRRKGLEHPVEKRKLGHPTLLDGGEARIAGELAFDLDPSGTKLVWMLNANSGRYCAEKPPTAVQIDNIARLFVNRGLTVTVDYMDTE